MADNVSFPLLPQPDSSGALRWPTPEQSVIESLRILLSTRPGERRMRPDFGVGLETFVGEPDSLDTRVRIREAVRRVTRWESRILLDDVVVDDGDRPGELRVELWFRLAATGEPRRLGATLSLAGD